MAKRFKPIGSVLANFSEIELGTAHDLRYKMKMSPLKKLAMNLIGLPSLGFRGRARVVAKEALKRTGPETRVLDAGCGYGIYSLTLAENGLGIIDAIDIMEERIAALKSMKAEQPELMRPISLKTGSLTDLPAQSEIYDLAICSDVLEHIADDKKAASELVRTMKPGGTFIISVPYNSPYSAGMQKLFGHERPGYTKDELVRLFGKENVKVIGEHYYEYWPGQRMSWAFHLLDSAPPLMALLFWPAYMLYRLDSMLKIGTPSGIILIMERTGKK